MLVECDAILFDLDGTLVDSTACVEAIWRRWAERHGINLKRLLEASHGRRTVDSVREFAPHLDIEQEAAQLEAEELECREGIVPVKGASTLLSNLRENSWAVVTSGGRALATTRLHCAGIPIPKVLVCAEDVQEGKPNPTGYLIAAERLGASPERCLVVEDTPAGILAGRSAGMQVLALTTTYPASSLLGAPCVRDFSEMELIFGSDALLVKC